MTAAPEIPRSIFFAIFKRATLAGIIALLILCSTPYLPYAGGNAWIDLPSHFVAQYAMGAIGIAVLGRYLRFGWRSYMALAMSGALCLGLLAPYVPLAAPAAETAGRPLKMLQANVLFLNRDTDKFKELIDKEKPDIVAAYEVNPAFARMFEGIRSDYPAQKVFAPEDSDFGMAVLSRKPFNQFDTAIFNDTKVRYHVFSIRHEDRDILFFSLHVFNPLSGLSFRDAALDAVANKVSESKTQDLVILGDLNATPWCPAMRNFMKKVPQLRNAREGHGLFASWPVPLPFFMRIPIDQTLISDNIAVLDYRLGPDIGSDHFPVISTLALKKGQK